LLFSLIYSLLSLYSSRISRFVFSHLHLLCTSLCYSIVKDQFLLPFRDSLNIIPQPKAFVNRFFKIFLKNFSTFFRTRQGATMILQISLFVKGFFKISC